MRRSPNAPPQFVGLPKTPRDDSMSRRACIDAEAQLKHKAPKSLRRRIKDVHMLDVEFYITY